MTNTTRRQAIDNELAIRRPIALIGLMGAGKSSVGRRLARRLDLPFLDADSEIEAAAGRSIADIFEELGEAAFRDGERRVIARLLAGPTHVLATGGGAFIDSECRALLLARTTVVWLRADLELLLERVSRRDTRPLLRNGDQREIMERLMATRHPIYAQAHLTVDSGGGPLSKTVNAIIEALEDFSHEPG